MHLQLEEWECKRCGNAMLSEQLPQDRLCRECRDFLNQFDEYLEQVMSGVVTLEVSGDD